MSEQTTTDHEVGVALRLNGEVVDVVAHTNEILLDTLRDRFGLTGSNLGCDHASCGACTVILDGDPRASCSTFTWRADGSEVTTIEGLGTPGALSPEQQAFAEGSAFQCGYCTPGLIMTTAALLDEVPDPDEATIRDWLSSNICRCTGYLMIVEAVRRSVELRRQP